MDRKGGVKESEDVQTEAFASEIIQCLSDRGDSNNNTPIQSQPSENLEEGEPNFGSDEPCEEGAPCEEGTPRLPCEEGSEVFVGRIPKDVMEAELEPIFSAIGPIREFRLILDSHERLNKGFAFVKYEKKNDAVRAITKLNGKELRRRQYLRVTRSVPNNRLFVGNIPKSRSKEELFQEFSTRTPGLLQVITYSSPNNERRNRGFCFLCYGSHTEAASAKRRFATTDQRVFNCDILVDWADPLQDVDDETMSKVKILYVNNVSERIGEYDLRELFSQFGFLERVKKLKDYAFIHFRCREDAARALENVNGKRIRGSTIEVVWAKPPTDKVSRQETLRAREKRMLKLMEQRPAKPAVNPFPRHNLDMSYLNLYANYNGSPYSSPTAWREGQEGWENSLYTPEDRYYSSLEGNSSPLGLRTPERSYSNPDLYEDNVEFGEGDQSRFGWMSGEDEEEPYFIDPGTMNSDSFQVHPHVRNGSLTNFRPQVYWGGARGNKNGVMSERSVSTDYGATTDDNWRANAAPLPPRKSRQFYSRGGRVNETN